MNKMLLERVRNSTSRIVSGVQSSRLRKWTPAVLLSVLTVYLFMGSACFWFFENDPHEAGIRKWYMNLAVNRRHFARRISASIFNDTKNLLIIIDREQTERVQQLLVEQLKYYEERLDLKIPDKSHWTFLNSFNYAYGLLLTLGHGAKIPETIGGQVFALAYAIFGIPLFYGTIGVSVYILVLPFLQNTKCTFNRRLLVLQMVIVLYVLWSLLLALYLYDQVFDNFWTSVFTSFISGLTIQVPMSSKITPCCLLVLYLACTVSATIIVMGIILFAAAYCPRTDHESPSKKQPLLDQAGSSSAPKFTVIVDEAGESKLAH